MTWISSLSDEIAEIFGDTQDRYSSSVQLDYTRRREFRIIKPSPRSKDDKKIERQKRVLTAVEKRLAGCSVAETAEAVGVAESSVRTYTRGVVGIPKPPPSGKLSSDDVAKARQLAAEGMSYIKLGKLFGVTRVTIRDAVIGRTFGNIGGAIHDLRVPACEMCGQDARHCCHSIATKWLHKRTA